MGRRIGGIQVERPPEMTLRLVKFQSVKRLRLPSEAWASATVSSRARAFSASPRGRSGHPGREIVHSVGEPRVRQRISRVEGDRLGEEVSRLSLPRALSAGSRNNVPADTLRRPRRSLGRSLPRRRASPAERLEARAADDGLRDGVLDPGRRRPASTSNFSDHSSAPLRTPDELSGDAESTAGILDVPGQNRVHLKGPTNVRPGLATLPGDRTDRGGRANEEGADVSEAGRYGVRETQAQVLVGPGRAEGLQGKYGDRPHAEDRARGRGRGPPDPDLCEARGQRQRHDRDRSAAVRRWKRPMVPTRTAVAARTRGSERLNG